MYHRRDLFRTRRCRTIDITRWRLPYVVHAISILTNSVPLLGSDAMKIERGREGDGSGPRVERLMLCA